MVRLVVSVVVRIEVCSTEGVSVEAVVTKLGGNTVVVGNTLGITTGVDLEETAVGSATENVSPRGVKETVVFGEGEE